MLTLEKYFIESKIAPSPLLCFAYIVWCVGISAYSLGSFMRIVQEYLAVHYSYKTEAFMVLAQVGFQWLFMTRSSWSERVRYMFIALSVSMFGSMILLPLLFYHNFLAVSEEIATAYFFAVVGVIFLIHHRLITRSSLPKILSCTWVLYRLLLLLFVLVQR